MKTDIVAWKLKNRSSIAGKRKWTGKYLRVCVCWCVYVCVFLSLFVCVCVCVSVWVCVSDFLRTRYTNAENTLNLLLSVIFGRGTGPSYSRQEFRRSMARNQTNFPFPYQIFWRKQNLKKNVKSWRVEKMKYRSFSTILFFYSTLQRK